MSMRKRKKVQILSREELMLRRWDFGLVPSERSLEAVGKSVDLHNIGRSMAFDLFPRTYRGKNRCVLRQKHVLINSRERARIWLHTRHQDEAIEPCGGCGVATKEEYVEILEFTHFVEFFSFRKIGENHKEKSLVKKVTVVVALDLGTGNTKNPEYESE